MLKETYELKTHRILSFLVVGLIYMHLWIHWQVLYWYDLEYLQQYTNLLFAAAQTTQESGILWFSTEIWLNAVYYLIPLLLFFNRITARLAFYVLFVVLYLPIEPYESVTVIGLVDTSAYTFVVGGIGILIASDISRFMGDSLQVSRFIASMKMKVLTFLTAILVVLVSFYVGQDSQLETLEMANLIDNTLHDAVLLSMPAMQALVFLALAAGLFIGTKKLQLICIVLSWVVLAYSGGFRLEWHGYHFFADLYALCSGVLMWQTLVSKEAMPKSGFVRTEPAE
ncbi:hypothetical protein FM042_09625 [Aliidiomarina halalkaliphila]|uniref:Uncharacterized protein n=1 Tax=Aliidiomarina halalkaliphila TaxID=2593535 RepID=A0A552X031_9GAMM|nr:hypothetical protein [Aliidiomarina halalkaliphila]TRW48421.1 hypothetical protein FM042_09625 [Aliidiomarina halalkaliphila]